MSYYDYKESQRISKNDPPFATLIMSAIRKADSYNIVRLRLAFPDIWAEFETRYNTPGGKLEGEK